MSIFIRHDGLLSQDDRDKVDIHIIGVGGIGSHTALALARMGYSNMKVYDMDVVEEANVGSQGFDLSDIGMSKVQAVRSKILKATGTIIQAINRRITRENANEIMFKGVENKASKIIFILALDSMDAREEIATAIYEYSKQNGSEMYVISPAMGGEYMTMDAYNLSKDDDVAAMFKSFFKDSDEGVVQDTCTTRATIYTTLFIASFIAKCVKDMTIGLDYVENVVYDIASNLPVSITTQGATVCFV